MKMATTVLLALACTTGLSACDDKKNTKKQTTQRPLALPESGLYETNLLARADGKKPLKALSGMNGLALVYPKLGDEQRWGVWLTHNAANSTVTTSQWSGIASHKKNKRAVFPVTLVRDSVRKGAGEARWKHQQASYAQGQILFRDTKVLGLDNKESSRWSFEFMPVGTKFADSTELYPSWGGRVALNKLATKEIGTHTWQPLGYKGLATAPFGTIETTQNGTKLTVIMNFPASGCVLTGVAEDARGNQLQKLTVSGFDRGGCKFDAASDFDPLQSKWFQALKVAKNGTVAYVGAFTSPADKKDKLVLGFPNQNGLMWVADKS